MRQMPRHPHPHFESHLAVGDLHHLLLLRLLVEGVVVGVVELHQFLGRDDLGVEDAGCLLAFHYFLHHGLQEVVVVVEIRQLLDLVGHFVEVGAGSCLVYLCLPHHRLVGWVEVEELFHEVLRRLQLDAEVGGLLVLEGLLLLQT